MAAAKGPVRPMADRIKDIYAPPAHVSISTAAAGGAYAPPGRTEDARAALARCDREQARILAAWAAELDAAQKANDWQGVARVRTGLNASAVYLEEFAGDATRVADVLGSVKP